jgi:hypothetical protein
LGYIHFLGAVAPLELPEDVVVVVHDH